MYRVYPYKGYVSVSDVWAGYPDGGSVDETKDKLKIAMIKRNSSDPNNPYAKKSKTGRMLEVLNKYQGFCGTWDGPKLASCGTICKSGIPDNCAACNFTFASCGFEVEGDNADRWDGDGGITVYRPDDVDNGKYIKGEEKEHDYGEEKQTAPTPAPGLNPPAVLTWLYVIFRS